VECSFYFEIFAPQGLVGVEKSLADSGLRLFIYYSYFNNKNILKSKNHSIELVMDTSTTDVMYGSGFLYFNFEESVLLMRKLSQIFSSAGYNHKIGIDDKDSSKTIWIAHIYS
jgi:hypothetical protein